MNTVAKTTLVFVSLLFVKFTSAQATWFVQADGNLSILPKVTNSSTYQDVYAPSPTMISTRITSSYEKKMGYNIKGGLQIPLSDKCFAEPALNFSLLRFRKKTDMMSASRSPDGGLGGGSSSASSYTGYGDPIPMYGYHPGTTTPVSFEPNPNTNNVGKTNLIFLSLDLNTKYAIAKHTNAGLGVSPYFLLSTSTYRYQIESLPGESAYDYRISEKKDQSKDKYNSIGLSGSIIAEQYLAKNLSLLATGTQYITRLYKEDAYPVRDKKSRMRYLSLGIRYYIR